jgi:two-component system, NtrC family, response regulator AtoC
MKILIADDDQSLARVIQMQLEKQDYQVKIAFDGEECLQKLESQHFDACILDLNMPLRSGLEVLEELQPELPCPVIVLTAYENLETAVRAIKLGAFDYLTKPFEKEKLSRTIQLACRQWNLDRENEDLKRQLFEKKHDDFVKMGDLKLQKIIDQAARSDEVIFISGETGTGKDYLARYIHALSSRSDDPFLAINCAAIPENLLESELFGHKKGSFTGASMDKTGIFEEVGKGILFLDEIGDMPLALQAKILRVLENKTYRRLGDVKESQFGGRVLSASNKDLEQLMRDGLFREDLLYRLNTIPIRLPPLRERTHEIEIYLQRFAPDKRIQESAIKFLQQRRWSGNIRELKNYCARMHVFIETTRVTKKQLLSLDGLLANRNLSSNFVLPEEGLCIEELLDDLLVQALERSDQNQTKAGELLGLTRQQVIHRMRKWKNPAPSSEPHRSIL